MAAEPQRGQARCTALPRCTHCGEVIGVYEPLVVDDPASRRATSLAAEPELRDAEVSCLHLACAENAASSDTKAARP